jgi:hypothetical protein
MLGWGRLSRGGDGDDGGPLGGLSATEGESDVVMEQSPCNDAGPRDAVAFVYVGILGPNFASVLAPEGPNYCRRYEVWLYSPSGVGKVGVLETAAGAPAFTRHSDLNVVEVCLVGVQWSEVPEDSLESDSDDSEDVRSAGVIHEATLAASVLRRRVRAWRP